MEEKYYTPHLAEFHLGFEYEELNILSVYDEHWKVNVKKEVFTQELWRSGYSNWNFLDKLKEGKIRVKYLDKEDIESLGFIWMEPTKTGYVKIVNEGNRISLGTSEHNNEVQIRHVYWVENSAQGDTLFMGTIKNKSELKKVLQMLGIE